MELLRKAAREPRVVAGLLIALLAVGVGYYDKTSSQQLADRDFAICGRAQIAPGCSSRMARIFTGWTASSGNGFRRVYHVTVATGRRTTETIDGLSKADVAPFQAFTRAELRYRQGRLTAIVGADGSTIKIPFAFTRKAIELGIVAFVLLAAGGGLFAWGFARINNRPHAPSPEQVA